MKWKQHDGSSSPLDQQSPVFSPHPGNGGSDLPAEPKEYNRLFDAVWFPYLLWGITLAMMILLVLMMMTRTKNAVDRARVEQLETRLEQLRSEISRISTTVDKLAGLDSRITGLSNSLAEAHDKLGRLSAETARIRKDSAVLREQLNTLRSAQPPATAGRSSKTIYHRVRRGETLYAISKRYGTTIKKLQKDNHLGARDKLHPGQVLKIRVP